MNLNRLRIAFLVRSLRLLSYFIFSTMISTLQAKELFTIEIDSSCLLKLAGMANPSTVPDQENLAIISFTEQFRAQGEDIQRFSDILIPKILEIMRLIDSTQILFLDFYLFSEWGFDFQSGPEGQPRNRIHRDISTIKDLLGTSGILSRKLVETFEPLYLSHQRLEFKPSKPWMNGAVLRVYIRDQTDIESLRDALAFAVTSNFLSFRIPEIVAVSIESGA